MKLCCAILLLILIYSIAAKESKPKPTRNVEITAEEEKVRDAAGYAAIGEIHREIDDDNSGSIDHNETAGFIKDDMKMRSSDSQRRANDFHEDDNAITIDDLWEAWFESPERAWTTEEIKEWIIHVVNLPMYAERVEKIKMDGTALPRIAAQNSTFMLQKLGIKSSVHRQLLRFKALDIVLFGYRPASNRTKDIILGLLVTELNNRLDMLKNMETEFDDVQKKWKEERSNSASVESSVAEVENLKIQLEEAQRNLVQNGAGAPLALQPLLRKTCEHEMAYLEKQRQECLKEMKEAIELVDRLQKKQSSVMSSLKLATGASSASDQVDSKIFALRSRMEKIQLLTRDSQDRWVQIESMCGFPILYSSEKPMSHSTSSHFGSNSSGSSSTSSKSASNGVGSVGAPGTQQPSIVRTTAHPTPNTVREAQSEHRTINIRMVPVMHAENASIFSDDTESIISLDKKKKRGILKIFKKSSSKNSLQNGSFGSNGSEMPTESKVEVSNGRTPTFPKKGKDSLYVVKIKCLPFGFFEKQLWEYFTQFGKVIRARVARSVKTGNHKGWAYVGFENKEVAEIAAETMNGYLMFEKKLLCHVMEKPPKCMLSGPRYVAPPHMKGQAKKAALTMNAKKTEKVEEKLKKRREKEFQGLEKKLKSMGVEYDLSSVPSLSYLSKTTNIKSAEADLVAKKKSVKGPRTGVSKIPKIAKDVTISKKKKVGAK